MGYAIPGAPLDSPAFTGTPTAPTAAHGTDTTQIATTAFVQDAVSGGGMTNPMTAEGDIIVGATSGAPDRLGVGGEGQVLTSVSGVPAWADPASGGSAQTQFPIPLQWPDVQTQGSWVAGSPDTSTPARYPGVWLLNGSGGLNDECAWNMSLPKGTYDVLLQHVLDSNRGQFTLYAGTEALTMVDEYAGSLAFATTRITGLVLSTNQTSLRLKVTGSSGGSHYVTPITLWLVKTA